MAKPLPWRCFTETASCPRRSGSSFYRLRKDGSRGGIHIIYQPVHPAPKIWAARSKSILQRIGITHILNAADGPYNINTGARYYRDLPIQYYGVQAFDDNSFDISVFFHKAADFIHKALNSVGGKVFVHCAMGLSRSATLVLAYLIIHENLTLVEALKSVDSHRGICPNTGFLSQLRALDIKLNNEKKRDDTMAKGD
ncbi:dual specificity protein phosphatase 13-like isoform X2 [Ahaetulla prasina]|uniref:dual specificity protein phosphatase 13-like isoform X2 n=1 Tax=Ahaetulla prasina TaxID=499056 RepID=UPI002648A8E9|nr:dual specificity protein phosphatase 13-like isoform X2 [Ahaetulla prasina]